MAEVNKDNQDKTEVSNELLKEIVKAVKSLEYGKITLVVHDLKIIQIDRTEKSRV
ncbi:MAG: YezD family protein [Clostridia bacterium]|nr:YezD family protein [Clostridia bacterium]